MLLAVDRGFDDDEAEKLKPETVGVMTAANASTRLMATTSLDDLCIILYLFSQQKTALLYGIGFGSVSILQMVAFFFLHHGQLLVAVCWLVGCFLFFFLAELFLENLEKIHFNDVM